MTESFGHFIRRKRKELGFNQTQLAVKLDMDAAKLSKIENSKLTIDDTRLPLVADALKIDINELKTIYFGDCIAQTLYKNKCNEETLTVAEEIFDYYKSTNAK